MFIGFLGWTAGFIRSQIALILSTGFPSVCNQGTISFYDKLQGIESSRNSLLGFYYFTPKMYQNFIEHPIILRCKSFFFKDVGTGKFISESESPMTRYPDYPMVFQNV